MEWFAVDGSRYAAWGDNAAASFTVLDTRTGVTRALPKDPSCSPTLFDGTDRVMASGRLLMFCDTRRDRIVLVDVRGGGSTELPRGRPWDAIGRRWIDGDDVFFDWHTGASHRRRGGVVRDLDDPGLSRVCDAGEVWFNYDRFYDSRFYATTGPVGTVVRRRCSGPGRLLGRDDRDGALRPFIAAGAVTWNRGAYGYLMRLRSGQRRRWRVPRYHKNLSTDRMQTGQTRTMAFFVPGLHEGDPDLSVGSTDRWAVYAVRR